MGKTIDKMKPDAHEFQITPLNIRSATQWALKEGWSPEKGPTMGMAYSMETKGFCRVPEGVKFLYEIEQNL